MKTPSGRSVNHEEVAVLVRRVQAGNRSAFDTLIQLYKGVVRATIRKASWWGKDDLEDKVQSTFVRGWLYIKSCRPDFFTPWIISIARNVAIGDRPPWYKGKESLCGSERIEEIASSTQKDKASAEQELEAWDTVDFLMPRLSERSREMLHSEFWLDESSSEQEKRTGIPSYSCRKWRQFAKREFGELYETLGF